MSIRFIKTQEDGGDCTAPYDVVIDRPYSVKEFINEILKSHPNEWGYFSIDLIFGQRVNYKYGKLIEPILDDLLDIEIADIKASGGWSRMDYYIKTTKPIIYVDKN